MRGLRRKTCTKSCGEKSVWKLLKLEVHSNFSRAYSTSIKRMPNISNILLSIGSVRDIFGFPPNMPIIMNVEVPILDVENVLGRWIPNSTARNVFWRSIWAELSCIQNIYKAISTGQVERVYLWWLSSIHWKGPDLHVDYSQFFSLHTHISPLPNPHEVIVGICPVSCPTRLFRSG